MSAQNWNAKKLENFLKSFKFISWIQIQEAFFHMDPYPQHWERYIINLCKIFQVHSADDC